MIVANAFNLENTGRHDWRDALPRRVALLWLMAGAFKSLAAGGINGPSAILDSAVY
jgi:hypothetical protein